MNNFLIVNIRESRTIEIDNSFVASVVNVVCVASNDCVSLCVHSELRILWNFLYTPRYYTSQCAAQRCWMRYGPYTISFALRGFLLGDANAISIKLRESGAPQWHLWASNGTCYSPRNVLYNSFYYEFNWTFVLSLV